MISWEDFFDRIVDVRMQFTLARKAIHGFRDTPEAVTGYAEAELDDFREDMQQYFDEIGKDHSESWLYDDTKVAEYLSDDQFHSHTSSGR